MVRLPISKPPCAPLPATAPGDYAIAVAAAVGATGAEVLAQDENLQGHELVEEARRLRELAALSAEQCCCGVIAMSA